MIKKDGSGGGAAGKVSKWKKMLSQPEEKPLVATKQGANVNGAAKTNISNLTLQIQIHDSNYSKEDVLLNSE